MLSKTHTKYIQSLHHKKFRDEYGVFIAEGGKVVGELLASKKFECTGLFALTDWFKKNEQLLMNHSGFDKIELQDFELEKISALTAPANVLALFKKAPVTTPHNTRGNLTLVLDTIQDPGNLGTIIRNADWFGVEQIICSDTCADCYNPKVVQSSMGSLGRVTIIYTDLLNWLQNNKSVTQYAAALEGINIALLPKINEGIIIIGNEGKGINSGVLSCADQKITIPRVGGAESLNAAVATGIILAYMRN